MLTQAEFRKHFEVAGERLFFNHAAYAPLSRPVVLAMNDYFKQRSQGNPAAWAIAEQHMEGLRQNYARLVNCPPGRIGLMQNTVTGLNVLASGLTWKAGDHILLYADEFPSNVMPFLNLREQGVMVEFIDAPDGRLSIDCFAAALRPSTRLISISSVQYLTGYQADLNALADLCHAHQVLLSVDGIQSVGVIPMNVAAVGIDFLAVGGHKWLMSPLGTGFLYLTESLQTQLKPACRGYMGHLNPIDYGNFEQGLSPDARRFELGTFNAPSMVGAEMATQLLLDCGLDAIQRQVRKLITQFEWGLEGLPFHGLYKFPEAESSGIFMFTHEDPSRNKAVFDYLTQRKVNLSLRGKGLRIAPHYYNTSEEIEALLMLLNDFS